MELDGLPASAAWSNGGYIIRNAKTEIRVSEDQYIATINAGGRFFSKKDRRTKDQKTRDATLDWLLA